MSRVPATLPPFADTYLAEVQSRQARRVVVLFHRWLVAHHLRLTELTAAKAREGLDQPALGRIAPNTRVVYRWELRRYLNWLAERGLAGPFAKEELDAFHRRPVPEVLRRFLQFLAPTHRPSTTRLYLLNLRRFHEWLEGEGLELAAVDRAVCLRWSQYLFDLGQQPATRVGGLVNLRKYLDWLWEQNLVATPGTVLIRASDLPKKPEYLPRPLPPDADAQLQARLRASPSTVGLGLYVMRRTGLRIGELRTLERDCIREDHGGRHFLKVPLGKLQKERLVPLDPATLQVLSRLQALAPKESPWLLNGSRRGHPMAAATYQAMLTDLATDLQLSEPMTTHRLRHSFATSLMNGGMSLMGIKTLLGHTDYRMTLRYTAIADETVGREYFEALSRVAERYDLIRDPTALEPSELEPVAATTDVIRWIETTLCGRAEALRDASLVHEAELVVRRFESARSALERLREEVAEREAKT